MQFKSQDRMSREDLAAFLRSLADRLDGGRVVLTGGSGEQTVEVGENVELEVQYGTKQKAGGTQHELELEVQWGADGGGVGLA